MEVGNETFERSLARAEPALYRRPALKCVSLNSVLLTALIAMFGIDSRLQKTISASKFRALLPIQAATLRSIYTWPPERDFLLKAGTGKGKTLAYILPVLNTLARRLDKRKKVLIVVPSAELAKQVASTFHLLAECINVSVNTSTSSRVSRISPSSRLERLRSYRSTIRFGTRSGSRAKNTCATQARWTHTCDVLIVTPSHLPFGFGVHSTVASESIFCVVDEADKLLRQTHQDWLGRLKCAIQASKRSGRLLIGEKPHSTLRTMLVSATIPHKGREAQIMGLRAVRVICEDGEEKGIPSLPVKLKEICIIVSSEKKLDVLIKILHLFGLQSTLVVASSVQRAHKLCHQLQRRAPGFSPVEFNSSASKLLQTNSLKAFRKGLSKLMIASDSASRGLDIPGINLVVSYDVPMHTETYIHRTGRTARAGASGTAITLCSEQHVEQFERLLKELNSDERIHRYQATQILQSTFTLDTET